MRNARSSFFFRSPILKSLFFGFVLYFKSTGPVWAGDDCTGTPADWEHSFHVRSSSPNSRHGEPECFVYEGPEALSKDLDRWAGAKAVKQVWLARLFPKKISLGYSCLEILANGSEANKKLCYGALARVGVRNLKEHDIYEGVRQNYTFPLLAKLLAHQGDPRASKWLIKKFYDGGEDRKHRGQKMIQIDVLNALVHLSSPDIPRFVKQLKPTKNELFNSRVHRLKQKYQNAMGSDLDCAAFRKVSNALKPETRKSVTLDMIFSNRMCPEHFSADFELSYFDNVHWDLLDHIEDNSYCERMLTSKVRYQPSPERRLPSLDLLRILSESNKLYNVPYPDYRDIARLYDNRTTFCANDATVIFDKNQRLTSIRIYRQSAVEKSFGDLSHIKHPPN